MEISEPQPAPEPVKPVSKLDKLVEEREEEGEMEETALQEEAVAMEMPQSPIVISVQPPEAEVEGGRERKKSWKWSFSKKKKSGKGHSEEVKKPKDEEEEGEKMAPEETERETERETEGGGVEDVREEEEVGGGWEIGDIGGDVPFCSKCEGRVCDKEKVEQQTTDVAEIGEKERERVSVCVSERRSIIGEEVTKNDLRNGDRVVSVKEGGVRGDSVRSVTVRGGVNVRVVSERERVEREIERQIEFSVMQISTCPYGTVRITLIYVSFEFRITSFLFDDVVQVTFTKRPRAPSSVQKLTENYEKKEKNKE